MSSDTESAFARREPRLERVAVRMSAGERAALERAARERGQSTSDVIREDLARHTQKKVTRI